MRAPKKFPTRLEILEDRTVPAAGEWLLRLEGLPNTTIEAQMEAARELIEAAHIEDVEIEVVDHATLDGNIVIEAPPATPLAVLTDRLSVLPGFIDVQPFEDEEEREAGDPAPAPDGSGPLTLEPGPADEAGVNLNVGLVGNEPTIAVNPLNPNNVVVGQFNNGAQTLRISLDGGATFPITRNGVLVGGQTFFQGDDSLAFDSQGRLFWTYLSGGSPSGPNVTEVQINPTTGAVIGSPTLVATSNLDKEWLAADKNPASPFANNLYVVWHDFNQTNAPVRFARSTNQGATWTTLAGNLSGANEGFTWPSEVAVAPNGDVWVAWHTNTGATNGEVRMRRSTDGGVTFGSEIIPFPVIGANGTGATTTNSASGLANKITGLHVWLQGSMQPRILVDPVRPGNIYVVSVDDPDDFNTANDPSDIVLARSTDNGTTWTRSTISQGVYGDSEIMPAAAIDAAGNIAVTWYSNRRHQTVPDSLGGTHYLLDLYGTGSLDGGLTFITPVQVNDLTNPFDPELGAPDRFSNHTLRIGEYNGLALVNGVGYAVWTGNTSTGQQIQFDKFSLGYRVIASTPAAGQVVTTAPTDFAIQLNSPVNPATVQASDLTINGIPADSFVINPAGDTITFHYNSTPVTAQGLQNVSVAAGAVASAGGTPVAAFSASFRYDALPLAVTSTNPPFPNGIFTLPGPLTYDVNFNEPFKPSTLQATDLTLSGIAGATVTGVTALNGNTTARFTISGITAEGTLTAAIAAGALTDVFDNPGLAFTAAYQVDVGTVPYPTPLTAKDPRGSLIYDPSVSGLINFAGDTDGFTLAVDPGQTITVVVDPTGSPDPALYGGVGNSAGSAAGGQLLLINPTNGASTVVGDPVTPGGLTGLVYDPSTGVFLGSTINAGVSTLVRINPDTGALIATVGTITNGPGGPTLSIGDLAIQPGTNVLFGIGSNAGGAGGLLFTINKATGVATLVGATGSGAGGGIAFAPDGSLYQSAFNSGFDFVSLNKIDPTTAARISTVPLSNYFDGLAIRPTDGAFFAALGGTDASIYTINPTTGAATLVGNTTSSTSDLAFRPSTALAPTVELRGPTNNLLASSSAGAGLNAVLQTVPAAVGGTYKITVGGASGTTGGYTLRVILNAAQEAEGTVAGATDNTRATAQDLGPSFVTLQTPQASAERGAVSGQFQGDDDFYAFTLAAGQSATLAMTATGTTGGALFGPRSDITGFDGPLSVAYGDLNGDGRQDMVAANYNPGTVSVLLGNGDGTFGAMTTYSLAATNPWTVVLGDVNGDGKRDIITSNIGSGTVSVLLGNGTGGFGAVSVYTVGTSPYGVAVGDLNGDGRDDVVSANYNTNDLTVRLGQADGTLGAATSYVVSVGAFFGPVAVGLGDFNGDGKLDAVSANYGGNNITLLLGNGAGGLGAPVSFAVGTSPFSIAVGDLNGDGRPDVVTGNNGGTDVSVRLGDGVGGFGAAATYASGGSSPTRVAIGDVDGDGRRDIAVSNQGSSLAGILLNTGGGVFGAPQTFATGSSPYGIALPDLNGDGLPDLSSANYSSNSVSVWLNATLRVRLQLQDATGAVLATGTSSTNLTAAINNFVAPAAGTYYARVFGGGNATYNLVVTRDAAFDTEPNDTFATAQSLGSAQSVLGSLAGAGTATLTLNATDSGWWDSTGAHTATNKNYVVGQNTPAQIARDYFVFNLSGVTQTITGAQLKLLNPSGGYISPDPSETYAVFDVSTPLAALQATGTGQVGIYNDLGTGTSFGSQTASAADNGQLVTVALNAAGVAALNAARGGSTAVGGALTTIAGTATQFVFAFTGGGTDVKQLVLNLGSPEDWYSVNVTGSGALRLETATPADGAGEFVNTLNPHIELYNPSGVLVATGTALADGRNEFIQYVPLVAGTYRVRVTGEGGTGGEYFLTKNFAPAPAATVTSPIDENGTATLSGTVGDADPLDSHTVVISWGAGEGTTTLTLAAGVTAFSAAHQYLDDNPTGSASDSYPVGVTVTDNHGAVGTTSTAVTVNNVAPSNVVLNTGTINENGTFTLTGSFTDPGTQDTHTVVVTWGPGEGTTTLLLATGVTTFSASHQYSDDNPTGTPSDTYPVGVTVTDDDTGSAPASTSVVVNNVAPSAVVLNSGTIDENGTFTLNGSFTDPGTQDTHTVVISWGAGEGTTTLTLAAGVTTFSASHQYLDDNPTGTASDSYPISVAVTDDDTGTAGAGTSVTVNNVAPSGVALNAGTIDENGTFTLTGSFTDPGTQDTHTVVVTWGPGEGSTTLALAAGVTNFTASHQYSDDNPTGTPSDTYPVGVTVTDDDTGSAPASTSVVVNNVAPVLAAVGNSASTIGSTVEGQAVTVSATFTDVGTQDTHAALVDWGDGTTTTATVTESGGSGSVTASHAYASGGVYTITVRLTDDDTGAAVATTRAYVSGVGLHAGILQIVGTAGADAAHVNIEGTGVLKVHGSFLPDQGGQRNFNLADVQSVQAFLGDGDDQFTAADNITLPMVVDGGAGNDTITASRGRNILIGGTGADVLTGSRGQDILIAGTTDFDGDSFALAALLAEWSDPTKALGVRVANLTDGTGSPTRANGNFFLTAATVHDDTAADRLAGKQDIDWLFFDPLRDRTDRDSGDLVGEQ